VPLAWAQQAPAQQAPAQQAPAQQAPAQDAPIPERFATIRLDTDYPGGDMMSLFDVTLGQCHATCLREGGCVAFTFNQRNGSCFLKETLGEPASFVGALSGVISEHDAATLDRARAAAASLTFLS